MKVNAVVYLHYDIEQHIEGSVLPRNFITGDNVPGFLKKCGHLKKKNGDIVGKMVEQ